ncbi:hypothetical protein OG612_45560 (plasmid) [Streptomyces sp. NBC_01527]|uniref:hypothetical protein n=1 Tax=Streptomyces sp. NBC_01527 TaxID=2903894 RepID=UPI002F90B5C2
MNLVATDVQAVLTELGTTTPPEELGELSLDHPLLDVWVRNRGDRKKFVRHISLGISAVGSAEAASPALEGTARPGGGPSGHQTDRLRPTTAYRAGFQLQEGTYRKTISQLIDPGEDDRFLLSLVPWHDVEGPYTYTITLTMDSARFTGRPLLTTSAPVQVRV